MKKYYFLIIVALILGLVLTGCSLLSNISQVPTTDQSGITYLTKTVPSHDDLVGLWHFSGNADDSSGTTPPNNGTVVGATYVPSPMGQALSFNGVNDYVEVPSDSSIMPATLTVEAWVQPGKIGARQSIVSKWDGGGDASYSLELTAGNKFLFYLHNGTTTKYITGTTTVSVGTWYHVAGTYDGSSANLYVDGNLEAGPTTLVAPMTNSNVPLRIGASAAYPPLYPIHSPFKGKVDEVRIWNVALSPDQLGFIYEFGGILPPIKADGSSVFKLGRTIPVKFQLWDDQSNFVTDAVANIFVEKTENGTIGEVEAVSTAAATTGNLFRYDFSSNQYIFNLSTKLPLNGVSWSTGTWEIRIELDDGMSYYVKIGLK